MQPFTLQERLTHAQRASTQLGATIPWIVDAMDNRLKHALGDRANSEYIVDPSGTIVRKRPWSDPDAVRKDLAELVGPVEKITTPEELGFKVESAETEPPAKGELARVSRLGMFPLIAKPAAGADEQPFFVKLRCEAELSVIDGGKGKLYLGFHLDPLYQVHWNNLNKPLRFELQIPNEIKLSPMSGEAPQVTAKSDTEPREFLLDVAEWPEDKAIQLAVTYYACTEQVCHAVRQDYVIQRRRDADGGAARGAAFRGLRFESMMKLLMAGDKNGDGKLTKEELNSVQRPRFIDYDDNHDGLLDQEEIRKMAQRTSSPREF